MHIPYIGLPHFAVADALIHFLAVQSQSVVTYSHHRLQGVAMRQILRSSSQHDHDTSLNDTA